MAVTDSSPKFMSSLALGSCLGFQSQTSFPVVEQVSSLIGDLFITAMVCVSILDTLGEHTMLVISMVHKLSAGYDCCLLPSFRSFHSTGTILANRQGKDFQMSVRSGVSGP